MAKNKEAKVKSPRFQEIRDAYKITKTVKPWIGALLIGIVLGVTAIAIALGAWGGHPIYAAFVGFPASLIVSLLIFTRIAGTAAYASIEGQIGAGA